MNTIRTLKQTINWFPGHMKRALRLIQENTHRVDLFLEIRDARIPFSSRNPEFDELIKKNQKQRVIVFNKYDLCDQKKTDKIIQNYREIGIACINVSTTEHESMRQLMGYLAQRYKHKYSQVGLWLMACGMPNVGKSSLINQLRGVSDLANKRAASKATPAVATTKGINFFRILQNPPMHLLDSPGVMIPSSVPKELGLKMAVLGLLKEQVVDKHILLRFIIEQSQADENQLLWKNLRIPRPLSPQELIDSVRNKHKLYDYDAAMDRVLTRYREGKLGKITLDDPLEV